MRDLHIVQLTLGLFAALSLGAADEVWTKDAEGLVRGAPAVQPCCEILWTKTVYAHPEHYCGWPTLCRRKSGELIIGFSGDRDAHVCPYGKVQIVRSADGGETWTGPETIVNGPLDDRDAGLIELDNGDLVLTYFTSAHFAPDPKYRRHLEKLESCDFDAEYGNFTRRSTDGGRTWEPKVRMCGSAPHGGIQLRDGRLLTVGLSTPLYGYSVGRVKKFADRFTGTLVCEISEDRGRSWKVVSELQPPEGVTVAGNHLCEPYVVELKSGRLIAQVRNEKGSRHTLQSESDDGGRTWTRLHETEIDTLGHPTHLLELGDGRLLCTFGRRERDLGVFVVQSRDGGRTWDMGGAVKLTRSWDWDFGYPTTVPLGDGEFLTVYYICRKSGDRHAVVMATKWRLKEPTAVPSQTLWTCGDSGVAYYRIPTVCTAPNGDLVAAADARVNNVSDSICGDPMHIVVRRSTDGGRTWGPSVSAWDWPWNGTAEQAATDASFIVDRAAGKIFLFCNVNDWKQDDPTGKRNPELIRYRHFVQESSDNGLTWSAPKDITESLAVPGWPIYGRRGEEHVGAALITGGNGIQTSAGLLLHTLYKPTKPYGWEDDTALFGSDDHGVTWKAIGNPMGLGSENKVVELGDGSWMDNARLNQGSRRVHVSTDRGATWSLRIDTNLVDAECNAALMRYGDNLIFSNCNSLKRENVCVRVSRDWGATWGNPLVLWPGEGAYSEMTVLPNGDVGVIYEKGVVGDPYRSIAFAIIPRERLGL